jgi:proteasome accessory factor B
MKKAERLLDLIAFLLNRREPVSFEEIQNAFPEDYQEGSEEAIARKFERDKADILALGLPLKLEVGDEFDSSGYVIDRSSYALPSIDLAPEELAMLYLAGSAALDLDVSPFERDLVLALNKIAFASGNDREEVVRPPRVMPTGRQMQAAGLRQKEHLQILQTAIAARKTVTISYHGLWKDEVTTRQVDPFGLAWRRGTWIMVGHCHLRDAIRVFHVERMRGLAMNPLKPKTPDFDLPAGFKMRDHVALEPWLIKRHAPVRAVIRFDAPVAETVAVELGPLAAEVEQDGAARVIHLDATNLDGLLPTVLWYRQRARVLAPPELIDKTVAALRRMAGDGAS